MQANTIRTRDFPGAFSYLEGQMDLLRARDPITVRYAIDHGDYREARSQIERKVREQTTLQHGYFATPPKGAAVHLSYGLDSRLEFSDGEKEGVTFRIYEPLLGTARNIEGLVNVGYSGSAKSMILEFDIYQSGSDKLRNDIRSTLDTIHRIVKGSQAKGS